MKAKRVHESVRKILKPKSKEEIITGLKNTKLPSYKLSLFFKHISIEETKLLKEICEELEISPQDMEVSSFAYLDYMTNYFEKLFQKKPYKTKKSVSQYFDFGKVYYIEIIFSYIEEFKVIKFEHNNYYAFPKKFPKEIYDLLI